MYMCPQPPWQVCVPCLSAAATPPKQFLWDWRITRRVLLRSVRAMYIMQWRVESFQPAAPSFPRAAVAILTISPVKVLDDPKLPFFNKHRPLPLQPIPTLPCPPACEADFVVHHEVFRTLTRPLYDNFNAVCKLLRGLCFFVVVFCNLQISLTSRGGRQFL